MCVKFIITQIALLVFSVNSQSLVQDVKLDSNELKCLVCKASIDELNQAVISTDRSRTINVGGHRLDASGNYNAPKTIPLTQSEIYLSELVDTICETMDDYVRGLWKSNGTLTVLKMVTKGGTMNPSISDVDIVQDSDLNKSLKYYCETIMEDYEENILKYYQNEEEDIITKFCSGESHLCPQKNANTLKKEL